MKHLLIGSILVIGVVNCKPPAASTLSDAATATSLKTGFFLPKLENELAVKFSPRKDYKTPAALAADLDLILTDTDKPKYSISVTPDGESILLIERSDMIRTPVASIDRGGKKYLWSARAEKSSDGSAVYLIQIYVKHDPSVLPKPSIKNQYLLRTPYNGQGVIEPVLVPWLDNLRTETASGAADAVLYRIGNVILEAKTNLPAMQFVSPPDSNNIWYAQGPFEDDHVADGTVFWSTDLKTYYSVMQKGNLVTKWTKQDKDSMDRVGSVDRSKVKIPKKVLEVIESRSKSGFGLAEESYPFIGVNFQQTTGGIYLYQEGGFATAAPTSAGLSLNDIDMEDPVEFERFFDPSYDPSFALAGGSPDSRYPVFNPKGNYNRGDKVYYPNPNGGFTVAEVTANKSVIEPGGFFSRGDTRKPAYDLRLGVDPAGKSNGPYAGNDFVASGPDGKQNKMGAPNYYQQQQAAAAKSLAAEDEKRKATFVTQSQLATQQAALDKRINTTSDALTTAQGLKREALEVGASMVKVPVPGGGIIAQSVNGAILDQGKKMVVQQVDDFTGGETKDSGASMYNTGMGAVKKLPGVAAKQVLTDTFQQNEALKYAWQTGTDNIDPSKFKIDTKSAEYKPAYDNAARIGAGAGASIDFVANRFKEGDTGGQAVGDIINGTGKVVFATAGPLGKVAERGTKHLGDLTGQLGDQTNIYQQQRQIGADLTSVANAGNFKRESQGSLDYLAGSDPNYCRYNPCGSSSPKSSVQQPASQQQPAYQPQSVSSPQFAQPQQQPVSQPKPVAQPQPAQPSQGAFE